VTADCEAVRRAALGGAEPSAASAAHVASCASCGAELAGVAALAAALAGAERAAPPSGLVARVLVAAEPLLDEHARQARARRGFDWRRLALALAPAVVVLPLVVALDVLLIRGAYDLLAALLPRALTTYIVASYGLLLVALAGLTFGAIPLLVQRQSARSWKEGHV
jgi:hypothetical protein